MDGIYLISALQISIFTVAVALVVAFSIFIASTVIWLTAEILKYGYRMYSAHYYKQAEILRRERFKSKDIGVTYGRISTT